MAHLRVRLGEVAERESRQRLRKGTTIGPAANGLNCGVAVLSDEAVHP